MDAHTIHSIMKVIHEFVPQDTSLAVTDDKQYLYYKPSSQIDLPIHPGDTVKEGTATHRALIDQKRVSSYIDKSILGTTYFGVSFPILDDGGAQGCITAIYRKNPAAFSFNFLTIKTEDRWIPVHFEKIMFLESQNRKTHIHADQLTGSHKYNLS